jgi:hypothetical protein
LLKNCNPRVKATPTAGDTVKETLFAPCRKTINSIGGESRFFGKIGMKMQSDISKR